MSKYRMYYMQKDEVKYISHLDFLRTVNRIFKRCALPLKYSNGFNPHTVMTIGLPLSVGTTSECDVLDIEFTQNVDTVYLKQKLNQNSPRGIEFTKIVNAEGLKPLSDISSAVYEAKFTTDKDIDLELFKNCDSVMIEKKSKRGLNEVNIKDFIKNISVQSESGTSHTVTLHLNAGNVSNLKPELVLKAIEKFYRASICNVFICRKHILFGDNSLV